jgi:FixJ family two-component response regulator
MTADRTINVALVDDDASLCKAVSRLLSGVGIKSIAYASAEAFLADHAQPALDCLLLDLQLGGMSGFDLQRHLVAAGSALPTIFLTACDEPEARAQAQRGGCVAYLRKTDPGQALIEAIRRAVALTAAGVATAEPVLSA